MLNAQELYDLAMLIEQLNNSATMRRMLLSEGPKPVMFYDDIIVGHLELVNTTSAQQLTYHVIPEYLTDEAVVFVPTTNQRHIPTVVESPGLSI